MRTTVILGLLSTMVSVAAADRFTDYASPSVVDVRTDSATGYRAIVSVSGRRSYLTIERLSRGRVVEQTELQDVRVSGRTIAIDALGSIALVGWTREGKLEFDSPYYSCKLWTGRSIGASCRQISGGGEPPPPPPPPSHGNQPSMADLNSITDACKSAFQWHAASHKDTCVASASAILKTRHRAKAVQVVQKCQDAFKWSGPDYAQTCISTVARGAYDPIELIAYCLKNNEWTGPDKQQKCMADFSAK